MTNSQLQRYQLSLEAENLPKVGSLRRKIPNPYAVVKAVNCSTGPYISASSNEVYVGRTSTIAHTCNPDWTDTVFIETHESVYMPLQISIYHNHLVSSTKDNNGETCLTQKGGGDAKGNPNRGDKLLAQVTFEATSIHQSVGRLKSQKLPSGCTVHASMELSIQSSSYGGGGVGSGNNQAITPRTGDYGTTPDNNNNNNNISSLSTTVQPGSTVRFRFRGLDFKNVQPGLLNLAKSDPYFELSKKNADYSAGVVRWNVVYRSEHIENHLNPYWNEFDIGIEELCYCDHNWPLRITLYDWNKYGRHRVIGHVETTLLSILNRVTHRGNADRDMAYEILASQPGDIGAGSSNLTGGAGGGGRSRAIASAATRAEQRSQTSMGLIVILKSDVHPPVQQDA